jgi:hypothetical protein
MLRAMNPIRSAIAILLALGLTPVGAEDWPQWRGPEGTGVSRDEGLPTRWGPQEGVGWKVPLEGVGASSPAVQGERVFVTAQVGSGEVAEGGTESREAVAPRQTEGRSGVEFVVRAVHRADGRSLWTRRFEAEGKLPPVQRKHNLATPTPVTDGERVYAWFGNGRTSPSTRPPARSFGSATLAGRLHPTTSSGATGALRPSTATSSSSCATTLPAATF